MNNNRPYYFDYAATTPVDERVADKMIRYLTKNGDFGNPSSQHDYGVCARNAIEFARAQVANYFNADPSEFIWTSGATEANNLAIKGAAYLYQRRGKHIITMKTEHRSVLDSCLQLEKEGYHVTYLIPEKNGLLNFSELESAIKSDTILVSIMAVNNEIGVIQDLSRIAKLTATKGILFHVDAVQAPGKMKLNLNEIPIDLLSVTAHKVYGPKGIGALFLRKKPRVRIQPLFHGGGHEQGMRSGTLPTHQIVGMGEAFEIAKQELKKDLLKINDVRKVLLNEINTLPKIHCTVPIEYCVPHIVNLRFENMYADVLLKQLPTIATSTASACQGKGTEGSYVLRALGYSTEEIKSAIRLSFGRMTTEEELQQLINALKKIFANQNY